MDANTPPGPGVDASGQAVVDPTRNVLDLVQAAISRQDDLREAESRHIRELNQMRDDHQAELRKAEAARINATRTVDVEAVQRAAEVQASQATALTTQVATTAEAMRAQVAAAAAAAATSLGAALEPIQKDIQDLRKAQYEAQGQKTQVVETQARGGSTALWVGLGVAASVGLLGTILTAVSVIVVIMQ